MGVVVVPYGIIIVQRNIMVLVIIPMCCESLIIPHQTMHDEDPICLNLFGFTVL